MKKIMPLLLLLLQVIIVQAQQLKECTKVEYVYSFNHEMAPFSMFSDLYTDGTKSIYQRRAGTMEDLNENSDYISKKPKVVFEPYQLVDNSAKKILLYEMIGNNNFLVEDNYTKLDWEVSEETKTIANYNCIKATTNFRGRTWIVWFTPEIAAPFGPWKLYGLPGLILEAEDSTQMYTFTLASITNVETDLFSKDFKSLMDAKNRKPISYQQYLEDREEYHQNASKRLLSKYNLKSTIPESEKINPTGLELTYEWDNQ